ncbi:MAG: alanine--tRNA ligase [Pseudomonadota bacterium]
MKSSAIRQAFLDYFKGKGHEIVASSSLIPGDDPTLLFTNAGMNQFKDCFLGREKRSYVRAATSQKCVRAGGKHNDLENVGYTARHHTFFEMLGNFSFGDYFKTDAIPFAWEFLTSPQWLNLPKEKLWVTVYHTDDEAYDLWANVVGVPKDRIIRIGDNKGAKYASDNFWTMGDTGPCGPCTEIFYDHGAHIWGGPPGSPEEDGDRYIEIWNVVFMQFDRQPDGTLVPLPKPAVDTGMGLERISAVMQKVHANYEIDIFKALIDDAQKLTGAADREDKSLRVIADHIRSGGFLIADGVTPSNEGRGYVLRRIIRRALRHGHKLGVTQPFFHKLYATLVAQMGDAYPELKSGRARVEKALLAEEEQFARTLDTGMKILEADIAALGDGPNAGKVISGATVFRLYDTYGFPADLTADIARERGLTIDSAGFEAAMEQQRQMARAAGKFTADYHDKLEIDGSTDFCGYEKTEDSSKVVALFRAGAKVSELKAGEEGVVVLDHTPFYAESGGQVGDTGVLTGGHGAFDVADTTKKQGAFLHHGKVKLGVLKTGDTLTAKVDAARRDRIRANHSATHLMHAALRQVLGTHVVQKGSLVGPDYLRFDFAHGAAVTDAEKQQIEDIVNAQIRANAPVETELMAIDAARAKGAMALFGEKYDSTVRVLSMGTGNFSIELCGGTHARRTGDIGFFRITSEGGVAAGVRRIEAVTGEGALAYDRQLEADLNSIAGLLKSGRGGLTDKVKLVVERTRELEREIEKLKQRLATGGGADLTAKAVAIGGAQVLVQAVEDVDAKALRASIDQLRDKLKSAVVVLGTVAEGKVTLACGVTPDLTGKVKAGELVGAIAVHVGGRGGGKPDFAQAGGQDAAGLEKALAAAVEFVRGKLS